MQDKWMAIINPSSGNGKTEQRWKTVKAQLKQAGIALGEVYTSNQGEGIALTRSVLEDGYKKIIAVGGDGTLNEVLNGLMEEDKPFVENIELAVLGHGTGSDFRRSLQTDKNIHSFITSLKNTRPQLIDIGKVIYQNREQELETRYFINASNLGIGTEVVNRVNQRAKMFGSKLTYVIGLMSTLFQYNNIKISMKLDDKEIVEGTFCAVMICNGQYIGGGMHIAPHAELNDGLFEVIVVKDISKQKLIAKFPLLYSGRHINLPEIAVYQCRSISVVTTDSTVLETDGEIIGSLPHEFRILPKCLRLRV